MEFFNELPGNLANIMTGMPTGFMFYTFLKRIEEVDDECIAFIIKEDQNRINKLKKNPQFGIMSMANDINKVLVVDILLRFEDIMDTIYETFINIRSSELGVKALESLSSSNCIYFIFFNEYNKHQRTIMTTNSLQKDFKRFKLITTEWLDWSMNDFDIAKNIYMKSNPDVFKLWNSLNK